MAMDDLYKALQMFQSGVQQYAITGAVNDANAQMAQLNQAAMDEGQKRQQLQQLANQTALRLTGANASGTQIQSAFNAINPQSFGSAEQMQLEGALSGNQQLQQVSGDIIGQREAGKQKQALFENKLQGALMDKKFQQDIFLKQLELGKQRDLKPADVSFKTNIAMANKLLTNLEGAVNEAGTWEAGNVPLISNKKAAAVLDAAPYQLAITYAKIVDPESVAREGEVAAAQKYMLDLGMFSSKEKVLEGLQNMRNTINSYQDMRGDIQGGGSAQATPAATGPVKVRFLPGGGQVKVQQQPNGTWKEVK